MNDAVYEAGLAEDVMDPMGGRGLAGMARAATSLLEAHSHLANALNVFPVPDGDTGTNMLLTMRAVAEAALHEASAGPTAESVARAMARSALMEARGNSGVILSQFFRGIAEGLEGRDTFDSCDLARALEAAADRSYGAVGEPVEGTMLTVIAEAAAEARRSATGGNDICSTLEAVCTAAERTVEATEGMLPVLTEAGVVDSGGYGVLVILTGMSICAAGRSVAGVTVPVPGGTPDASIALSQEFLDRTEHAGFGHCTQLLVRTLQQGDGEPDLEGIRRRAGELASSVVVVGDAELVKIHVHTDTPDEIVAFAGGLGEIIDRSIQDMDVQRTEFASGHRRESASQGNTSLLAVSIGDGLAGVFSELGSYEVVSGGPTMNPSVRDLVDAIERAPADRVIVLPNDGNVVATAEQAASVAAKKVLIVPTESVQQGVAAALAMDTEKSAEANAGAMIEAVAEVRSGSVTIATRDVTLNGIRTNAGRFIGVLDGKLVASGTSLLPVLEDLLVSVEVGEEDLVTLYRGSPISEEDSVDHVARLRERFEETEIDVVAGGQPHYHYLVSVE